MLFATKAKMSKILHNAFSQREMSCLTFLPIRTQDEEFLSLGPKGHCPEVWASANGLTALCLGHLNCKSAFDYIYDGGI